ncbi:MAG: FecR domain-containing protein [Kiritimatiellae bacterium]|nr:FecR domain-containing protein [Kiritimatiellia bacterium]
MSASDEYSELGRLDALKGALDLGEITPDERRELSRLVQSRPALGAAAGVDVVMDRLIRYAVAEPQSADEFVTGVRSRIAAEASGDRFVEEVVDRSRELGLPRRPAGRPEVGRRRWHPRPRPGRGWRMTALAASILVVLGVFISKYLADLRLGPVTVPPGAVALVQAARGDVRFVRADITRPAAPGQELAARDRVVVAGPDSGALVVFPDSTRLELSAAATLIFERQCTASAKRVFVAVGRLVAEAVSQAPDTPMTVTTPHARLQVAGTRFSVVVDPHSTRAEVMQGAVLVQNTRTHETVRLRDGEYAILSAETVVASRSAVGRPPAAQPGEGLLALYLFDEGRGPVVHDRSGVGQPLHLVAPDLNAIHWLPGGGLALKRHTLIASTVPAAKISDACRASNELTIEAWIRPATTQQGTRNDTGPCRVVTLSGDYTVRNFTLGQWGDWWNIRVRTTETGPSGVPNSVTRPGSVTVELMHVVFTRAASGQVNCYVNGRDEIVAERGQRNPPPEPVRIGGTFAQWDSSFRLALGDEFGGERAWLGEYYRVAIYSRALTAEQAQALYEQGLPSRRAAP